jgi:transcriptional regulator with PAS, ATPase and Fis domain
MSETVIESELFGHTKGAYTGADTDTIGLIRSAHKGVLFMDEIGELSLGAQAKLLRTLQERKVRPVGSSTDYEVDIQVVAATNRNLSEEVDSGNFRQDLYYRLNAVTLEVPSLRQRKNDIALLAHHFLKMFAPPDLKAMSISDTALELLVQYNWPGNVRELQNVINGALVFAEDSVLTPEDLPNNFNQQLSEGALESPTGSLADYERSAIKQALIDAGNNRRRAAEILNIAEATLYRKIKKYGL